jgi:hypothetical protein
MGRGCVKTQSSTVGPERCSPAGATARLRSDAGHHLPGNCSVAASEEVIAPTVLCRAMPSSFRRRGPAGSQNWDVSLKETAISASFLFARHVGPLPSRAARQSGSPSALRAWKNQTQRAGLDTASADRVVAVCFAAGVPRHLWLSLTHICYPAVEAAWRGKMSLRNDISGLLGFIGRETVWRERLQDVVAWRRTRPMPTMPTVWRIWPRSQGLRQHAGPNPGCGPQAPGPDFDRAFQPDPGPDEDVRSGGPGCSRFEAEVRRLLAGQDSLCHRAAAGGMDCRAGPRRRTRPTAAGHRCQRLMSMASERSLRHPSRRQSKTSGTPGRSEHGSDLPHGDTNPARSIMTGTSHLRGLLYAATVVLAPAPRARSGPGA